MVDVVHRHAVQQEEVLVWPAAAHIHARHAFRTALHARHQLHHFDDVGLAKDDGHRFDLLHGYLDAAGDGTLYVLGAFAYYLYFLQRVGTLQFGVEALVGVESQGVELGFASHKRDSDYGFVVFECEAVAAVLVGDGAFVREGVVDGSADECFTSFGVGDSSADGVLGP